MLTVANLSKSYPGGRDVLRDIEFTLKGDETVALVGPSGCGKTTLLYMLCGLSRPDTGRVLLDGREIRKPGHDIAIILQQYGLHPWKTVRDNVALGLKLQGVSRAERNERARELLHTMGLADREQDFPSRLSGGEQQRVAIARAYASRPRLLLMDEPFSALDAMTRETLQAQLIRDRNKTPLPYVLVTHSIEEAAFLGRTILLLAGSPATIRARFDNPGFGDPKFRESNRYFELVRDIRRGMGAF
ncbi:MAG TPA: ABC transporter ATP-binding protein [Desulfomicrobiaceae bacterium]|nr:ABC transporter ATP-binding protein [Desulfomicrobiaceae bacterium]